jgi:hypothetical protein
MLVFRASRRSYRLRHHEAISVLGHGITVAHFELVFSARWERTKAYATCAVGTASWGITRWLRKYGHVTWSLESVFRWLVPRFSFSLFYYGGRAPRSGFSDWPAP